MRIIKDADGDLWLETSPGRYQLMFPQEEDIADLDGIHGAWGPFTTYGLAFRP